MQRILLFLALVAAAAGIALGGFAFWRQQRAVDQLERLQQTMAGLESAQREALDSAAAQRAEGGRWVNLLMRAQETPWVGDERTPLRARVVAESDFTLSSEPVRLLAEVRNVSDHEVTVSAIVLEPYTLKLLRDGVPATYVGPQKGMAPPPPVALPAGRTMRARAELTPSYYRELSQPGNFALEWVYSSESHFPSVTWAGSLPPARTTWRSR